MEDLENETLGRKEERMQKANKIFCFFFWLCIAAVIFCLLFPHGTFIFLTCLFFLCWIVAFCVKRTKGAVSIPFIVYPIVVFVVFCMAWMLLIIPILEVIFCRHRPWEYALEINYYKDMDAELSYFPQKLPRGARNVEWIVVPTVWQAKGCLVLALDIDAFDMSLNPLLPQHVELSLEEVETAVDYQIDSYGSQGFIVVEESNRIIFYRDYEW